MVIKLDGVEYDEELGIFSVGNVKISMEALVVCSAEDCLELAKDIGLSEKKMKTLVRTARRLSLEKAKQILK